MLPAEHKRYVLQLSAAFAALFVAVFMAAFFAAGAHAADLNVEGDENTTPEFLAPSNPSTLTFKGKKYPAVAGVQGKRSGTIYGDTPGYWDTEQKYGTVRISAGTFSVPEEKDQIAVLLSVVYRRSGSAGVYYQHTLGGQGIIQGTGCDIGRAAHGAFSGLNGVYSPGWRGDYTATSDYAATDPATWAQWSGGNAGYAYSAYGFAYVARKIPGSDPERWEWKKYTEVLDGSGVTQKYRSTSATGTSAFGDFISSPTVELPKTLVDTMALGALPDGSYSPSAYGNATWSYADELNAIVSVTFSKQAVDQLWDDTATPGNPLLVGDLAGVLPDWAESLVDTIMGIPGNFTGWIQSLFWPLFIMEAIPA